MTDAEIDQVLAKYRDVIPVPVVDIAQELGLKIFLTKTFSDKKSGEIVKENGNYSIYLNADHGYTRSRFTLAHEIAHFRLHKAYLDKTKEIEDFVGTTYSLSRDKKGRDKKEWEADMLAGEILMPEEAFIRIWNKKATIKEVAEAFNVSESAAYTRAKVLANKET